MRRSMAVVAVSLAWALTSPLCRASESYEPWPSGTGVQLGNGWNSRAGQKTLATCVEFDTAEVSGQNRDVRFGEASDRSSLMRTFSVSTKAKAKSILGGSGSASASLSRQTKIEQQNLTFAIDARIHDAVSFVVPKGRGRAIAAAFEEQLASRSPDTGLTTENIVHPGVILLASSQGSADSAVKSFLAEGAPLDGVQKQLKLVALGDESIPQVRLTRDAKRLLRNNPIQFRSTCGDGFVSTIRKGAGIQGVYTLRTNSREERQEVKGKVGGSFGTFSASVASNATLQRLQSQSRLDIRYVQLGGSGTAIATSHESFLALLDKIGTTTSSQTSAPFEIGIIPYTDLPGLQDSGFGVDPLAVLADQYLRLEGLDQQMNDMIRTENYWFDKRITKEELKATQDATKAEMGRLRAAIESCDAGAAPCKIPDGLALNDYHVRMRMPVDKNQVRLDQNVQSAQTDLEGARRALRETQPRVCWRGIAASPLVSLAEQGPGDGPGGPDRPSVECHTNPRHTELIAIVKRLEERVAHLLKNRDSTIDRHLIWVEQPAVARCENREVDLCLNNQELDRMRDEMLAL